MGTYIIYNTILIFSVLFAYLSEYSKTKLSRLISRLFLFMVLFIPSAIRYNIGTDYRSYIDDFYSLYGGDVNEVGFQALIVFLRYFDLPAHSLFICSAFLVQFPLLFLSKKNYSWKIMLYILLLYLQSFSAVRNMISLSFVILLFDLLFQGKNLTALVVYPISLLFHISSFIFLPFFFLNKLQYNKIVFLVISLFVLCISYFDVVFVILNNNLFFETRYAKYLFGKFSSEPTFNTGYGMLLKILYTTVIFVYFVFYKNKNYSICYLFLFYLISLILATKVVIIARLVDVLSVSLIFAIPLCLASWCSKYKIIFRYLTILFYLVLFELFIKTNDGNSITGDHGIYPYQTILQK